MNGQVVDLSQHQASCDVTRGGPCSCPEGDPRRHRDLTPDQPDHITLTGVLPSGEYVLVTVWDEDGKIREATPGGIEVDVATRYRPTDTWSAPAQCSEVPR